MPLRWAARAGRATDGPRSTPARWASSPRASTKPTPCCCWTNVRASPDAPQPKQLYRPFSVSMLNDGLSLSGWNGQRAIAAAPFVRVTSVTSSISRTMSVASRTSDAALEPITVSLRRSSLTSMVSTLPSTPPGLVALHGPNGCSRSVGSPERVALEVSQALPRPHSMDWQPGSGAIRPGRAPPHRRRPVPQPVPRLPGRPPSPAATAEVDAETAGNTASRRASGQHHDPTGRWAAGRTCVRERRRRGSSSPNGCSRSTNGCSRSTKRLL